MGFRNLFARSGMPHEVASASLLWGVRRRRRTGEIDNARLHKGLTQHAFIAGDDARALCGYRPFRWRAPAVPLTIAREQNPQCRKCLTVIRVSVSADDRAPSPIAQLIPMLAPIEVPEDNPTPPNTAIERKSRAAGRRARTKPARRVQNPALLDWPPRVAGV
jgi:hypothetical protein